MSMKMSIDAYKELIDQNIEWLNHQRPSCERTHLIGIAKDSVNCYYPVVDKLQDIKNLVMVIAQADTSNALQDLGNRGQILIDLAKDMTYKYDLFDYWR